MKDARQFVQVRTRAGALRIDIESPEEALHVSCPLAAVDRVAVAQNIDGLSAELEARRPMA